MLKYTQLSDNFSLLIWSLSFDMYSHLFDCFLCLSFSFGICWNTSIFLIIFVCLYLLAFLLITCILKTCQEILLPLYLCQKNVVSISLRQNKHCHHHHQMTFYQCYYLFPITHCYHYFILFLYLLGISLIIIVIIIIQSAFGHNRWKRRFINYYFYHCH